MPDTITFPVYVRLARYRYARHGFYVSAGPAPNPSALRAGNAGPDLATVHFKLDVQIPREVFEPAKWPVIEIELGEDLIRKIPVEIEVDEPPAQPEPEAQPEEAVR
jgi:hypothetical protein